MRTEDSLFTSYAWLASFSPSGTTKILKNPHKLKKSSKPGLQDCTICATLIVSGVEQTKQGTRSPIEQFWTAKNLLSTVAEDVKISVIDYGENESIMLQNENCDICQQIV